MKLGIVFPQLEIGNDPAAIRDFAVAAEELGFDHILIYDHVLGAERNRPGGFSGPYDTNSAFHEPFVTFGFLAGLTKTIEFCTGVLVLPQRQTALVAKQAAELQNLSGGRLRLGVGVGWNAVEYEALGCDFGNRGRRQVEQIDLMKRLWAEDIVDFEGRWHRVDRAGINPRPTVDIPIWFGGSAPQLIDRIARQGDGWIPIMGPNEAAADLIAKLRSALSERGRAPGSVGVEAQAQVRGGNDELWATHAAKWRDLGATHLAIATMNAGLATPDDHIEAARTWKAAVDGAAN